MGQSTLFNNFNPEFMNELGPKTATGLYFYLKA